MPRAQLSKLSLQGAYLSWAKMQGCFLAGARMQGADLKFVQMQGAYFSDAQMQGAFLSYAQMQGANFIEAQMQGADFYSANMQGAKLNLAQMQGADLHHAQLQGADLRDAQMQGTDLQDALIQGTILSSTSIQGVLLDTEMPVYGKDSAALFEDGVIDWAEIEKKADAIPDSSTRQYYLKLIKQAQQPNQINQAQQKIHYEPKAIANSALSAICNSKDGFDHILPRETRLASAQAFRKSYINIGESFKKNPDYPKILLDINYQLCTLNECKDLRDGIEGLDCQKALQNPPKW